MRERGFSLVEIMMVILVFSVITGAVFGLLSVAQQRYKMESEFLDSFQTTRLAIDQMVRDIHTTGYPPIDKVLPAVAQANPTLFAHPMAWNPGYDGVTCTVNATCRIPGTNDIILETDVDPEAANGVEWIRYMLVGTTLFRGMASKQAGVDPTVATRPNMVAYIENVVNERSNLPGFQQAILQQHYANLWPGGADVPVFRYGFGAAPGGTAADVVEVQITLIVMAPNLDPQTRQPRVLSLNALAHRFNP